MQIFLNGEAKDVPQGTTLSTLLPSHPAGCGVAILRPGVTASGDVETPRDTSHLRFTTTAGGNPSELFPGVVVSGPFRGYPYAHLPVLWDDKNALPFCPFRADFFSV